MNFKLQQYEKILMEGKANRSNILFAQGGTLVLTNKRLIFVGHSINIGSGTISINLDDILTFSKSCTFLLPFPLPIPNSIKIENKNGKKYKFTVFKRKKWLEALSNAYRS